MTTPPELWKLLYENLFASRDKTATFEVLSRGLDACTRNAGLLLKDAELLLNAKRYSRTHFFIATADEEMAKTYLILDACRLSFDNQENHLRQLCPAFYGHVEKHAYNRVYRSDIKDMPHAKEFFIPHWFVGDHLATLSRVSRICRMQLISIGI